jgi:isoleucyl-tRNA synthetase
VLHEMLLALVRLMAPILAFTAEEIWGYLPAGSATEPSVHLTEFPQVDPAAVDEVLAARWDQLLQIRGEALKALEQARMNKLIGTSLEALVHLYTPAREWQALLEQYRDTLASHFIVSSVVLHPADAAPADALTGEVIPGLRIQVVRAPGRKCVRCWHYREDVGQHPEHPTLCGRCVERIA